MLWSWKCKLTSSGLILFALCQCYSQLECCRWHESSPGHTKTSKNNPLNDFRALHWTLIFSCCKSKTLQTLTINYYWDIFFSIIIGSYFRISKCIAGMHIGDLFSFTGNRRVHVRWTEDKCVPGDPDTSPTLKKAKNMLLMLMTIYERWMNVISNWCNVQNTSRDIWWQRVTYDLLGFFCYFGSQGRMENVYFLSKYFLGI